MGICPNVNVAENITKSMSRKMGKPNTRWVTNLSSK